MRTKNISASVVTSLSDPSPASTRYTHNLKPYGAFDNMGKKY